MALNKEDHLVIASDSTKQLRDTRQVKLDLDITDGLRVIEGNFKRWTTGINWTTRKGVGGADKPPGGSRASLIS